ncbi:hypothetical protein HXX76_009094 [Chlamydomonas incerta]|uniref:Protein kinase domain-containing protein n=1 Tax=Chlamydomonas incerta TaxID=51695 RepID=A0A835SS34_CHLIN|nr:hypothetical protein HXX76_009094 [Chlamydomonas incerta]|eukprot:KAG2432174.1 hypothetical protein HXX76_009094 [Chlamydomonas incerta]
MHPAVLDLRSLSGLFSVPPNGTLDLRGLSIVGAALPSAPFPLPAAGFLALSAFRLGAGARLRLVDCVLTVPSCALLSLHQTYACRVSPSPNVTVTPSGLVVRRLTTPSLDADNVTVQCAGAAAPFPCLAASVRSGIELLAAVRSAQKSSDTAAAMFAKDSNLGTTLNLHLAGHIVLAESVPRECPDWSSRVQRHFYKQSVGADAPQEPCPVITNMAIVLQGAEDGTTVLDLAGSTSLFALESRAGYYGTVELRRLQLRNPPAGPLGSLPYSLMRLPLWTFDFRRRVVGAEVPAFLRVTDCVLELPPEEVAMWRFRSSLPLSPQLQQHSCLVSDSVYMLSANIPRVQPHRDDIDLMYGSGWSGCFSYQRLRLVTVWDSPDGTATAVAAAAAAAVAGGVPAGESPPAVITTAAAAGAAGALPGPQPPQPQPQPQHGPLGGAASAAATATAASAAALLSGWPALAAAKRVELLASGTGAAAPSLCLMIAPGSPMGITASQVRTFVGGTVRADDVESFSAGAQQQLAKQVAVNDPGMIMGEPLGVRVLDLAGLVAAVRLSGPGPGCVTLRHLVLIGAPPASAPPAIWVASPPPRQRLSPPPSPPQSPPSVGALSSVADAPPQQPSASASTPAATRSAGAPPAGPAAQTPDHRRRLGSGRQRLLAQAAAPAAPPTPPTPPPDGITQGLAPALANFTSCLWTFEFDRSQEALAADAARGGEGRPAGLPRLFLDGVVLVLPEAELQLLGRVWAASADLLSGRLAFSADTDTGLAAALRAMVQGSVLGGGGSSNPGGGSSGGGNSSSIGVDPDMPLWFPVLNWCGYVGFNVTLTSALPVGSDEDYGQSMAAGTLIPALMQLPGLGLAEASATGPGQATDDGQSAGAIEFELSASPPPPATQQLPHSAAAAVGPSPAQELQIPPLQNSSVPLSAGPSGGHSSGTGIGGGAPALSVLVPACVVSVIVVGLVAAAGVAWERRRRCRRRDQSPRQEQQQLQQQQVGPGKGAEAADSSRDSPFYVHQLPSSTLAAPPCSALDAANASAATPTAGGSGTQTGSSDSGPGGVGGLGPAAASVSAKSSKRSSSSRMTWALGMRRGSMHASIQSSPHSSSRSTGPLRRAVLEMHAAFEANRQQLSTTASASTPHAASIGGSSSAQTKAASAGAHAVASGLPPPTASFMITLTDTDAPADFSSQPPPPPPPPPPGGPEPPPPLLAITGELGRGAQGVVYRGLWRGLDVAVKSVLFHLEQGAGGMTRDVSAQQAVQEAAIAVSMAHPNIVATYTYQLQPLHIQAPRTYSGQAEAEVWKLTLIQELCDANSLRHCLQSGRLLGPQTGAGAGAGGGDQQPPALQPLAARTALLLACDIARGLAHLHERGVVHADLSSNNVLLQSKRSVATAAPAPAPDGGLGVVAKLCDFGLSGRLDVEADATHLSGPARRSSAYSAPELVAHGRSGPAGDVYAFAVVLWELALGLPLPAALARPESAGLRAWLSEQARLVPLGNDVSEEAGAEPQAPGPALASLALPPGLLWWPPGAPPGLVALVAECLRPEPRSRPSAAALLQWLQSQLLPSPALWTSAQQLEPTSGCDAGSAQGPGCGPTGGAHAAGAPAGAAPSAAAPQQPAALDLRLLSGLFSVPPNGTLELRGLSIVGAALPSAPFPLPAVAFLALSAFRLGAGARLRLVDCVLTVPPCALLSLHQTYACGLSPSPNVTVTPSGLVVRRLTTPSLDADNVTVQCAGAAAPFPCLAASVRSGTELLAAVRSAQKSSDTAAAMFAKDSNLGTTLNLHLAGHIVQAESVPRECPDWSSRVQRHFYKQSVGADAPQEPCPVITNMAIVLQGAEDGTTVLDLAGSTSLLPYSLMRLPLWTFEFRRRVVGAEVPAFLCVTDCVLELPPEEVAMWRAAWDLPLSPQLGERTCFVRDSVMLPGATLLQQVQQPPLSDTIDLDRAASWSSTLVFQRLRLETSWPQLLAGLGAAGIADQLYWERAFAMGCFGSNSGDAASAAPAATGVTAGAASSSVGRSSAASSSGASNNASSWQAPAGCQKLKQGKRALALAADNYLDFRLEIAASIMPEYNPQQQVPIYAPAMIMGEPLGVRVLDLAGLVAAVRLSGPGPGCITLRHLVLIGAPPASAPPAIWVASPPPRQSLSPPPSPPQLPPSVGALASVADAPPQQPSASASTPAATRSARAPPAGPAANTPDHRRRMGSGRQRLLAQAAASAAPPPPPPPDGITQGLAPALANFTSCLWTFEFDRSQEALAADAAGGGAAGRPAGLPSLFLDGVVLVLPEAELQLLGRVWAASADLLSGRLAFSADTDTGLAAALRAMVQGSVLADGGSSRGTDGSSSDSSDTGGPVTRLWFALLSWCGYVGTNVTLSSTAPPAEEAPATGVRSSSLSIAAGTLFPTVMRLPVLELSEAEFRGGAPPASQAPFAFATPPHPSSGENVAYPPSSTPAGPPASLLGSLSPPHPPATSSAAAPAGHNGGSGSRGGAAGQAVIVPSVVGGVVVGLTAMAVALLWRRRWQQWLPQWLHGSRKAPDRQPPPPQGGPEPPPLLAITGELARGAQGVVYRGVWRGLDVAVKSVLFHLEQGPGGDISAQQAVQEAAIAVSMAHPNIVATYTYQLQPLHSPPQWRQASWVEGSGAISRIASSDSPSKDTCASASLHRTGEAEVWKLTLIQELCDANSLRHCLQSGRLLGPQAGTGAGAGGGDQQPPALQPLAARTALLLACDIARGLAHLHERGVVHADLSSNNVLLQSKRSVATAAPAPAPDGGLGVVAKLCDFGLSGRLDVEADATHLSGPARRSSAYSAPELVAHGRSGPAGDVYAFAVVLWELALGLPLPAALARPESAGLRAWLSEQARLVPLGNDVSEEAGAEPQAPGPALASLALPPGLLWWPPGAPPRLVALVAECLRPEPRSRPSAAVLLQRLQQLHEAQEDNTHVVTTARPQARLVGLREFLMSS